MRGSLTTEAWETQNQTWLEVNRMLKEFEQMQDMMKKMKGGGMMKMMKRMGAMKGMPKMPFSS